MKGSKDKEISDFSSGPVSFGERPDAIPLMHPAENGKPSGEANATGLVPREREQSLCPCKSRLSYALCCLPFHQGKAKPETAEQLMRSRYSAYFFRLVDYLVETTHPETRAPRLKQSLEKIIHQANWSYLTILGVAQGGKEDKRGKVEFVAEYFVEGEAHELHEVSRFKRFKGAWKYLDVKGSSTSH